MIYKIVEQTANVEIHTNIHTVQEYTDLFQITQTKRQNLILIKNIKKM